MENSGLLSVHAEVGWARTFWRLLQAETFRIMHSRGVWVAVVVMAYVVVSAVGIRKGAQDVDISVAAILAVCVPLTCVNDLDAGCMKSLLVGRHARGAYMAVLLVLTLGIGLLCVAIARLAVGIAGAVGYGDGVAVPGGAWIAWTSLRTLACVAPGLFVAALTRSQPLATIVAILVACNIPGAVLADILQGWGFAGMANFFWSHWMFGNQMTAATAFPDWQTWLYLGSGIVLWSTLGFWVMTRRDVSVHGE